MSFSIRILYSIHSFSILTFTSLHTLNCLNHSIVHLKSQAFVLVLKQCILAFEQRMLIYALCWQSQPSFYYFSQVFRLFLTTSPAPANTVRLGLDTPCASTGECAGINTGNMCSGCKNDRRICCGYVVTGFQRDKDRIKVILVNEELGY